MVCHNIACNVLTVGAVTNKLNNMENTLEKLIEYFEQQLRSQRESDIKYTGEEAYFDSVDVCKNALKALRQPTVIGSVCHCKKCNCEIKNDVGDGICAECWSAN